MVDVAKDKGLTLDLEKLGEQLPVRCVSVQANRGVGIEALKRAIVEAPEKGAARVESPFPEKFIEEVETLGRRTNSNGSPALARYLVERLLLDTSGYLAKRGLARVEGEVIAEAEAARKRLAAAGIPVPAVESMARYGWAAKVLEGVVTRPAERPVTTSDRIDRVL